MATKHDNPCLKKAGDDEPIFVLRAQDKTAPGIVRIWALNAEANGCPEEKVQAATDLADRMEAWAKAYGSKYPD